MKSCIATRAGIVWPLADCTVVHWSIHSRTKSAGRIPLLGWLTISSIRYPKVQGPIGVPIGVPPGPQGSKVRTGSSTTNTFFTIRVRSGSTIPGAIAGLRGKATGRAIASSDRNVMGPVGSTPRSRCTRPSNTGTESGPEAADALANSREYLCHSFDSMLISAEKVRPPFSETSSISSRSPESTGIFVGKHCPSRVSAKVTSKRARPLPRGVRLIASTSGGVFAASLGRASTLDAVMPLLHTDTSSGPGAGSIPVVISVISWTHSSAISTMARGFSTTQSGPYFWVRREIFFSREARQRRRSGPLPFCVARD